LSVCEISMVKVEQQVFTLTEPGPIFCILYKKWQLKEECFLCIGYLTVYLTAGVDKVEALRKYKFSLAFENSNVEDYVTEKFFQALVAGTAYCFLHSSEHIRWHVTWLHVVESCFTSFLQWFSRWTTGLENMIVKTQ
jgi:hypothetical protein